MNQVVIVTGASGWLGSKIALTFGLSGASVVVHYNRTREDALKVAKEINKGPGRAITVRADVRKSQEVHNMVEEAVKTWGSVDVLINNAGGLPAAIPGVVINPSGSPIYEMDDKEWKWVVDSNLLGTFNCIKAVAPQMIKQLEGHIINISSSLGVLGMAGRSNYSAAKSALFGLSKSAARELGEFNVKVNVVMPGPITPPQAGNSAGADVGRKEGVLHRAQTREEFASFIVHLTKTKNISGQVFNLDNRIL